MAKYIIDIPDEEETMWEGFNGDLFIPITMNKGTKTWVNTDLKMIPYTEPDRKAIEDEVWEFAKKVRLEEFIDEEGRLHGYISGFNSYSEAKAKYDAWKKQKDEIHVGDELKQIIASGSPTGAKCIVVKTDGDKMNGIGKDGSLVVCSSQVKRWWTKTGRSFPEVAELLKKMGKLDD